MAAGQPHDGTAQRVGVIGLGAIGGPVARTLRRGGWGVLGYDVRDSAFDEYPEATRSRTVQDLAEASGTVLIAVYDDAQLREVLSGADGILSASSPPATVCVLSTITLETLRWAAAAAAEHQVELLDCGVTGGTGLRTMGKIVVFAGGSDGAVEAARPVLETFADPLLHMGSLGAGMQAKLARNLMHYSGWYAAWEAARVAAAAGVDIDKLIHGHQISNERSDGAAMSLLIRGIRPGARPGDEASVREREAAANFARKDLGYVLDLARELGISLPGAELVRERADLMVGLAEEEAAPAPGVRAGDEVRSTK
jgi:3-hydroxyisobutyrate dehydrogenase-like beta-hydroxyacid dehydrogenase